MPEKSENSSISWLQRLKDESWEAELLISTIAIFGTIQLFKGVDWLTNYFINTLLPGQYLIGYMIVFMGLLAVSLLVSMFVIHFALRAYWVGLVGLNSVFPDYSLEESAYSELYTSKILAILPKLNKTIKDVDEICSVIFSAAFLMLYTYLYLALVGSLYLVIYNALIDKVPAFILWIPLYLFGLWMVVQAVFSVIGNLKQFRNNKWIQTAYFQSVRWGSIIVFGPLYKYLLQISMTFGSNFKKKKSLVGLILIFVLIGFIISLVRFSSSRMRYLIRQDTYFDATKIYGGYYGLASETHEFLISPCIDTDVVDSKVVRLFIPIYDFEYRLDREGCVESNESDPDVSKEQAIIDRRQQLLDCYSAYHSIELNERSITPQFHKYRIPSTDQFGVICYIDLSGETAGNLQLKVRKELKEQGMEWQIPFYYVGSE